MDRWATTKYGVIPREHWSYPDWINVTEADAARAKMEAEKVIYGGSLSYRHMCRFNSGFFFRHELLKDYEFYWR
ncbi:MAG: glycosyl transferase, partial [Olpidium bornovanus]